MVLMLLWVIPALYAQYEWQKPIQSGEVYKGTITKKYQNGFYTIYEDGRAPFDFRGTYSVEELYSKLFDDARKEYGSGIILRQLKYSINDQDEPYYTYKETIYNRAYIVTASVCTPAPPKTTPVVEPVKPKIDPLKKALTKALQDIKEGSRLALDQIRIVDGDKEDFKDQIVELLLDEGYKVVAKDYLEKLYEEQQAQQSGIYNERTTVQENNFSAVGYYINVKKTETAIKVQVINVSTGEYESNITESL